MGLHKNLLDYFSTPKVVIVIVIKYKTNAHSLHFSMQNCI